MCEVGNSDKALAYDSTDVLNPTLAHTLGRVGFLEDSNLGIALLGLLWFAFEDRCARVTHLRHPETPSLVPSAQLDSDKATRGFQSVERALPTHRSRSRLETLTELVTRDSEVYARGVPGVEALDQLEAAFENLKAHSSGSESVLQDQTVQSR